MKTISETINSLMPSAINKEDELYKALYANEDEDGGAATNEVKDVVEFINYYTNPPKIDYAHTSLLEAIVKMMTGLERRYSEPDSYLRLRYKAFTERKGTNHWNSVPSIKGVFSYFFPEKDIYFIERYPVNSLLVNGNFDTMDGWTFNDVDAEFRLIYSRSFEDDSAMYINPRSANMSGYMEQKIENIPAGLYEFVFFFSSPKGGLGDVQFSIKDSTGWYWNGTAWITTAHNFYEVCDDNTPGYYKPIQKTINIPALSNITIRFQNKNGNGVLIDSARFGRISEPSFRMYITAEPDLFFDGSIFCNKQYNFSGFREWYIEYDMEDVLRKIKPAGVFAQMSILSSRLNIPWDRILLNWETNIKTNWHSLFDNSKRFNSSGIRYIRMYFDGSITANSEFKFDGLNPERFSNPGDLLWGTPVIAQTKNIKKRTSVQLTRKLYFDGRIGANGDFTFSGNVVGIRNGYSYMRVKKWVTITIHAKAIFDGSFRANGEIKFDGDYSYQQAYQEEYLVKEAS